MPQLDDKEYDYCLKFLLVGDADVGKEEILSSLEDSYPHLPYATRGLDHKSTLLSIDGKRVKLQLWNTSGQGRFCTILRSYSRGAQGILLVYDITNKWSFDGITRWLGEVNEHAPGVPKVLIGNRLHLAFRRQVTELTAELYAQKHDMTFFEVSPLCDFNVVESFAELSRLVLKRNGMNQLRSGELSVPTLQELCIQSLTSRLPVYAIDRLPLPTTVKAKLRVYSMTHKTQVRMRSYFSGSLKGSDNRARKQIIHPGESPRSTRRSCSIS